MKKTIVIVILVVYIASIAVVNFFGLSIKEFNGVEYVQEIECKSITVLNGNDERVEQHNKDAAEGEIPEFRFNFIPGEYTMDPESLATNPNRIRLNYKVLPPTADGSQITFEYDEEGWAGIAYFDEARQEIVFLKKLKRITITLKSTDGSNVSTTIRIMGK